MTKSLAKVQSKIIKKKGRNGALHEKSRAAKTLRRAGARADRLEKVAAAKDKADQPLLQRVAFFHNAAKQMSRSLEVEELHRLIQGYLSRSDEALAVVQSERRPGRPTSTKEDMLKQRMAAEEKEYNSGFWMPDLQDSDNVERLQVWNGEWAHLNTLKYINLSRDGASSKSKFPPKG